MSWRVAKSLEVLRKQLNEAYPNRSKVSDGTIGDPSHQAEGSGSDHNPNKAGVVCALDITHDPSSGVDIDVLSDELAASRDGRIKYIIANGLIMVPSEMGWNWGAYEGSNPHTSHLHLSVWGDYDNENKWNIGAEMVSEQDVIDIYNSTAAVNPSKDEIKNYVTSGKSYRTVHKEVYQWAIKNKKDYMWFVNNVGKTAVIGSILDKTSVIDYLSKNLK